jgi:hypothetical protein
MTTKREKAVYASVVEREDGKFVWVEHTKPLAVEDGYTTNAELRKVDRWFGTFPTREAATADMERRYKESGATRLHFH